MNAWLLTWEWATETPAEKIVAILSSRRSESAVSDLMELLVLRSRYPAHDLAYYANRKKKMVYKAQTPLIVNGIPHGERILCGRDPWLYGRKVRDLKITVDESVDEEIIFWREPKDFKFFDDSKKEVIVESDGDPKSWRRPNRPLSKDVWAWEV